MITIEEDASYQRMPASVLEHFAESNARLRAEDTFPSKQEHNRLSREAISASARLALDQAAHGERTALVLGAGYGSDVPVHEIVSLFDRVRFVELDPGATQDALAGLPEELEHRVTLTAADITGRMSHVMRDIDSLRDRAKSPADYAAKAARVLRSASRNRASTLHFGGDYTFVCSHLVASQLGVMPLIPLRQELARTRLSSQTAADFTKANDVLWEKVAVDHVDYLANTVSPTGIVHFADTVFHDSGEGTQPAMRVPISMLERMSQQFDFVAQPQEWLWESTPDYRSSVMAWALSQRI